MISGVPLSHLGPILFNLLINDVVDVLSDSCHLIFADDLKIFKRIADVNNAILLQQARNNLVTFFALLPRTIH